MFQNAFKELQSVHPRCGGLHVRDVCTSISVGVVVVVVVFQT
jgi:hypothetical protein